MKTGMTQMKHLFDSGARMISGDPADLHSEIAKTNPGNRHFRD
jgi:hypothetical protein